MPCCVGNVDGRCGREGENITRKAARVAGKMECFPPCAFAALRDRCGEPDMEPEEGAARTRMTMLYILLRTTSLSVN